MTKQILLARHADALEARGTEMDIDRQLSPKGEEDAKLLGQWLKEQEIKPDKIYVSTAQRTLATADIYAKTLNLPKEKLVFEASIYQASLNTLHHFITNLHENINFVMIIGHNPTVSHLADFVAKTPVENFSPGGMCLLRFEGMKYWEELVNDSAKVIWYQNPKKLRE